MLKVSWKKSCKDWWHLSQTKALCSGLMSQLLCDIPKLPAHVPSQSISEGLLQLTAGFVVPVRSLQSLFLLGSIEWLAANAKPESWWCSLNLSDLKSAKPIPGLCGGSWLLICTVRVNARCLVSTLRCWQTCTDSFEATAVALFSAVSWCVNQGRPRCVFEAFAGSPLKALFIVAIFGRSSWLGMAGVHTCPFGFAGTGTRYSGETGGLEAPAPEHSAASPPQVYAADWDHSPCPFWRSCWRTFSWDPRCLHCSWSLLSHSARKRAHSSSAWGSWEKLRGC